MADTKISALPASTTPLAGTEVLPIVQSGATKQVSVDDLTVKNVRSNATTGILQIAGPGAGATRVMTTPNANFTAARTDAAQSFTGDQTILGNLGVGKTSTSAQIFSWGDVSTTYDGSGAGADLGAQIGANTVLVSNSSTTTSTFSQIVFQPSESSGPTYARIAGIKASAAASDLAFSTRDGGTTKEGCRLDFNQYFLVGYTASNGAYKLQVNSQIFATSSTIATSDRNYKTNIKPLNNTLDIVMQLNPVTFNWKKHPVHNFDCDVPTVGFIAQEVQMVLSDTEYRDSIVKKNECVLEKAVENESGEVIKPAITEDFYGIAEGNLIALLTKALQELNQKFDSYVASHP